MPRTCLTCRHPRRSDIESAIALGAKIRTTARDFKVSAGALTHHLRHHVARDIAKAKDMVNGHAALTLLQRIQESHEDLKAILKRASDTNELTVAVNAIQGGLRALELEGRVTGELAASGSVTIVNQLGVRVDVAKLAVDAVQDAQTLPPRAVVERAAQVIRLWNAQADPEECVEVLAPRSSARVID